MHVLVLVLDGLPARWVGPSATPVLHRLATEGGWAPEGGRAVMTTSTAPNLASFATGTTPGRHGITTERVPSGLGLTVVDAAAGGPATPTLFDALAAADRSATVAVADRRLLGFLGAARADVVLASPLATACRPDPDLALVDAADAVVATALATAVADAPTDLVVGHLRLPDAAAHHEGPDSRTAAEHYRSTDARLGSVLDGLRARWGDWLVVVLSDHDQEPVTPDVEPVDLVQHLARRGLPLEVVPEGGAALVLGPDRREGAWLAEVPGVAGSLELRSQVRLAWARPGRVFGPADEPLPRSVHGGPGATAQVAVVTGGHPLADELGRALARRTPAATDWAPTLAEALAVPLPTATGRSLLAGLR
jgi:hypothetical protein